MKEATFNSEVVKSFKQGGCFAYKIGDPMFNSAARFADPRPFDIFFFAEGRAGAIESKQIKKWQPFGIAELAKHQREALDLVEGLGHFALVFLNVRIPQKENRLIAWNYKTLKNMGRYKTEQLKELPYIQGKYGLFDLDGLHPL